MGFRAFWVMSSLHRSVRSSGGVEPHRLDSKWDEGHVHGSSFQKILTRTCMACPLSVNTSRLPINVWPRIAMEATNKRALFPFMVSFFWAHFILRQRSYREQKKEKGS